MRGRVNRCSKGEASWSDGYARIAGHGGALVLACRGEYRRLRKQYLRLAHASITVYSQTSQPTRGGLMAYFTAARGPGEGAGQWRARSVEAIQRLRKRATWLVVAFELRRTVECLKANKYRAFQVPSDMKLVVCERLWDGSLAPIWCHARRCGRCRRWTVNCNDRVVLPVGWRQRRPSGLETAHSIWLEAIADGA